MELTGADLDSSLVPTYGVLGVAYQLLLEIGGDALEDALGELDASREDLERVKQCYLALRGFQADSRANIEALCVLAYLLQSCGRERGISRAGFEVELAKGAIAGAPTFHVPFWVPSVPGMHQRKLLFPLIAPARTSVIQAYEGLVHHLRDLGTHPTELSSSAILWRVVALSDGLCIGGTRNRFHTLRHQVVNDPSVLPAERDLWRPLGEKFINFRDALSHMKCVHPTSGNTLAVFADAVAYADSMRDELIEASSALGLAVLQDVASQVSDMRAPKGEWDRVLREHEWVNDQL